MKEKKFLIYLDILGFKNLAEEIARKTKFNEDIIREKFLSEPLKQKIEKIGKDGVEWRKGISAIEGSDDYVLLVDDDFDKLFKVIGELSMIKIPHEDYNFIPLEIAVDIKEIEMIVKDPINLRKVIDFLKNDIINPYRTIYKKKHGKQSEIKETFILFTDAALSKLGEHHKKECIKYNYLKNNKKKHSLYYLPSSIIEREIKIRDFLDV